MKQRKLKAERKTFWVARRREDGSFAYLCGYGDMDKQEVLDYADFDIDETEVHLRREIWQRVKNGK